MFLMDSPCDHSDHRSSSIITVGVFYSLRHHTRNLLYLYLYTDIKIARERQCIISANIQCTQFTVINAARVTKKTSAIERITISYKINWTIITEWTGVLFFSICVEVFCTFRYNMIFIKDKHFSVVGIKYFTSINMHTNIL